MIETLASDDPAALEIRTTWGTGRCVRQRTQEQRILVEERASEIGSRDVFPK